MGFSDIGDFMLDPINLLGGDESEAAAKEQYAAQRSSLAQQQANIDAARSNIQGQTDLGVNAYIAGAGQSRQALDEAQKGALGSLAGGYEQGTAALGQGYQQGRADLAPVQGLQRYEAGATGPVGTAQINAYDVTGQQFGLEGRLARGDQAIDQAGQLYQQAGQAAQMDQDPGYQFRRQQGEQAINRSAAARGGRLGGSTLKALADYNSGLASQEYGAANERQMARTAQQAGILGQQAGMIGQQYGAAGNVDAMRQGALVNQAGRTDAAAQQYQQNQLSAGLAAQQNQMGLAQMGYGAQGQLANMAQQYGQQGAQRADEYGQSQAEVQARYGQSLSDVYQNQAAGTAGMYSGQMGTELGLATGSSDAYKDFASYGGMVNQAKANEKRGTVGMAGQILGSIFCDRELKTDVEGGTAAIEEMLAELTPYTFRYADENHGSGRMLGIMAQDLERSAIGREMVRLTDVGRVVDKDKALMALLGVVAHLYAEIQEIKKGGRHV